MTMPAGVRKLPLVVITYRDVHAWVARLDQNEEAMIQKHAAIVRLGEADMKDVGVSVGGTIRLSNAIGSVVVRAQLDSKCPKGFAFMPMSHIPNQLTSYESGRLPNFKWIEVTAEAVPPGTGSQ
ncbi:MAG: molybdopterin dinucleotide binding domain-containing protein [Dehalococcoidia bacterium]|nr:molybdopterin dinucleotide binding domain-containing protein [Dehalococcoidia bacterium]